MRSHFKAKKTTACQTARSVFTASCSGSCWLLVALYKPEMTVQINIIQKVRCYNTLYETQYVSTVTRSLQYKNPAHI